MHGRTSEILRSVARLGEGHGRPSSGEMASAAHRSQWNFHRLFRAVMGEAPVGFGRRVALDRAAARLVADAEVPVAVVAADAGFDSHEGFTRAFARRFGSSPSRYRARGLVGDPAPDDAARHQHLVDAASPCIGVYRIDDRSEDVTMTATVDMEIKELPGFSALVIRRRVARDAIATTLAECLPRVFEHVQRQGLTLVSPPFVRYPEVGVGTFVVESGFAVLEADGGEAPEGGIERIDVPPGRGVVAVHRGAYDDLGETYGAIERWLDEHSLKRGGPAWETYLTDPGDHPDPADWRTEITQPLAD